MKTPCLLLAHHILLSPPLQPTKFLSTLLYASREPHQLTDASIVVPKPSLQPEDGNVPQGRQFRENMLPLLFIPFIFIIVDASKYMYRLRVSRSICTFRERLSRPSRASIAEVINGGRICDDESWLVWHGYCSRNSHSCRRTDQQT